MLIDGKQSHIMGQQYFLSSTPSLTSVLDGGWRLW